MTTSHSPGSFIVFANKVLNALHSGSFYGFTQLHRSEREVWLMPIGHLLDRWEIHKQFTGISQPKKQLTIDDIIPVGID